VSNSYVICGSNRHPCQRCYHWIIEKRNDKNDNLYTVYLCDLCVQYKWIIAPWLELRDWL